MPQPMPIGLQPMGLHPMPQPMPIGLQPMAPPAMAPPMPPAIAPIGHMPPICAIACCCIAISSGDMPAKRVSA